MCHTAKHQTGNVSDMTTSLARLCKTYINVTSEDLDILKCAEPCLVALYCFAKQTNKQTKQNKATQQCIGYLWLPKCKDKIVEEKKNEARFEDLQYSIGFRSTGITEHKPKLNGHRIKKAPSSSSS